MKLIHKYIPMLLMSAVLFAIAACAATDKREATGEYVDDSVITAKIKAAILNTPTLKVAEINVETFKGIVQLSGFISSRQAANEAVEIARGIGGVKSVKDDMRIK